MQHCPLSFKEFQCIHVFKIIFLRSIFVNTPLTYYRYAERVHVFMDTTMFTVYTTVPHKEKNYSQNKTTNLQYTLPYNGVGEVSLYYPTYVNRFVTLGKFVMCCMLSEKSNNCFVARI